MTAAGRSSFAAELLDALRIVDRGDLSPDKMRGAWAGEIGQTQFMPSSYLKFAIDFNGDGSRDLVHDTADVLASTANFLHSYGWQRGAGWDEGEPNFPVLLRMEQGEGLFQDHRPAGGSSIRRRMTRRYSAGSGRARRLDGASAGAADRSGRR